MPWHTEDVLEDQGRKEVEKKVNRLSFFFFFTEQKRKSAFNVRVKEGQEHI